MSDDLKVITSQRGGQKILLNGFMFTKKNVSKKTGEVIWRCAQRALKCPARLWTTDSLSEHRLDGEHVHLSDPVACEVETARQSMKRKATVTNDRPNQILSFTVADLDDEVKARMPRPDVSKRVLRRVRSSHRPRDPQSLQELDISGPWSSNLLFDNGRDSDERVIIFASPAHVEKLAASDEWCMDGTFSVAPRLFSQLYVIQGLVGEGYLPLAFALLQRKTQTSYETVFRVLEEYGCDPASVMVDFERPVELALRVVFGEQIQVRFCFYHLSQSIWRQIQGQGLKNLYEGDNEFRLFCGQLDALAFLPPEEVKAGMDHLRSTMPDEAAALVEYFDSTYVSGQFRHQRRVTTTPGVIKPLRIRRSPPMFAPDRWNQHQATLANEPRTNNICEGWNNKFSSLVGHANPTVWKLIECLQAEAATVDAVLLQDDRGVRQHKRSKRCYIELQVRLYNLVVDYKEGRKTIPEFLRGISHNLRGGQPNV